MKKSWFFELVRKHLPAIQDLLIFPILIRKERNQTSETKRELLNQVWMIKDYRSDKISNFNCNLSTDSNLEQPAQLSALWFFSKASYPPLKIFDLVACNSDSLAGNLLQGFLYQVHDWYRLMMLSEGIKESVSKQQVLIERKYPVQTVEKL